jgi:tetratricopeptide (TPR) repeat protein
MIRTKLVVVLGLLAVAGTANAQAGKSITFKRGAPPVRQRPACEPVSAPASVSADARRRARDLVQNGRQAAILGDSAAALAQLKQASTIDPTDSDLAYELARAYESSGANANAAKEYCRFLALAPAAPEAAEARNRVASLAPVTQSAAPSPAVAILNDGIASFERGKTMEAEAKFAEAIRAEPTWADAYYDRAIARATIGDNQQAATDFEEYLRLKPTAEDRVDVVARIESLRRRPLSAGQALGLGLIIPGAGEFYTRRPLRGALALVGTSAAIALSLQTSTSSKTVEQTGTDPFGNPYTYTTTQRTTDQPYLIPGLLVGGAIAVATAVDAYRFAKQSGEPGRRLSMIAVPTRTGIAARVSLLLR